MTQTRKLGSSDLHLTTVGLGAVAVVGGWLARRQRFPYHCRLMTVCGIITLYQRWGPRRWLLAHRPYVRIGRSCV